MVAVTTTVCLSATATAGTGDSSRVLMGAAVPGATTSESLTTDAAASANPWFFTTTVTGTVPPFGTVTEAAASFAFTRRSGNPVTCTVVVDDLQLSSSSLSSTLLPESAQPSSVYEPGGV